MNGCEYVEPRRRRENGWKMKKQTEQTELEWKRYGGEGEEGEGKG